MNEILKALNDITYYCKFGYDCRDCDVCSKISKAICILEEIKIKRELKKPKHINKHLWKKDEFGEIDEFAYSVDYHNGPVCKVCGYSFCIHCHPEQIESDCYIGYYICPECNKIVNKEDKMCSECGQYLDWSDIQ